MRKSWELRLKSESNNAQHDTKNKQIPFTSKCQIKYLLYFDKNIYKVIFYGSYNISKIQIFLLPLSFV